MRSPGHSPSVRAAVTRYSYHALSTDIGPNGPGPLAQIHGNRSQMQVLTQQQCPICLQNGSGDTEDPCVSLSGLLPTVAFVLAAQ
jgi:hypothetical protein